MKVFDKSPQIYSGGNSLSYLKSLSGEKIFIVTDRYMVSSGTINLVTEHLKSNYVIFSDVEADPSIETVANGLQKIFEEKPETIIALGGGSAIDAAKAMIYFCIKIKGEFINEKYIKKPLFIAIPTTSGTGSEATSYAVITDRVNNIKIPLANSNMIPDVALLNPEFTKTLPKAMIAYTGMDVVTHAIEAYVSKGHNRFSDIYAKEALLTAFQCLTPLYENAEDYNLRESMMMASTMAGIAFTNSGLGINHGIAHTIGAEFHLPHGLANSILLPYVIAFNLGSRGRIKDSKVCKRYAEIAKHIGITGNTDYDYCIKLIEAIKKMNKKYSISTALNTMSISKEDFMNNLDNLVEKIMKDKCTEANPIEVSDKELRELLINIYEGTMPR